MIIIGNGILLGNTPDNAVIHDGAIAVEGNLIKETGATATLRTKYPGHEFIDAEGALIMPGIINAHHHFYSAFARGMIIKNPKVSKNFMEILQNLWWKLDEGLTLEDVYYSGAISIADSIKCGVTTIIDHHAGFGAVRGSLTEISKAAADLGMRSCLCFEVSDRCGTKAAEDSIEENRSFIESAKSNQNGMLAGLFGLHASFTISDDTLKSCKKAAGDAGFHVHVAEGLDDVEDSLKKYGKRVVERLADFGILGEKTLAAHCIHVNPDEMKILADSKTTVIHNPQSNMGNAVGCSPLLELIGHGIRVGIGTDGYTHDMIESFKTTGLLQRHHRSDPSVAWAEPSDMLLKNNPDIAGEIFGRKLGVLAPGAAADIIIVDYDPLTELRPENISSHLHFGIYGPMVKSSMINGKLVMRDRKLLTVDEKALKAKTRSLSKALWSRL